MKSRRTTQKRLPPNVGGEPDTLRLCALTGTSWPEDRLIRLVLSPAGELVADLGQELPGPELWLTLKASILQQAEEKKLPEKHFGQKITYKSSLPALAEKALRRKALGLLGLLKKQGKIISGISKSADSLKKNKVLLLLVADSAKNYGSDDVRNLGSNVLTADCFSLTELQSALSNGNSMHVVLKGDALALRCFDEIRKLLIYLERIELNDK